MNTWWRDYPPGIWVITKFSNFTQIEDLEKKKWIATLFGICEECPYSQLSDSSIYIIKKCNTDIGITRVIILYCFVGWDRLFARKGSKNANWINKLLGRVDILQTWVNKML